MPEDVLEWGSSEPRQAHTRSSSWADRLAVPPVTPYVLAGLGAIAYFVSLSQPWRIYKIEPSTRGLVSDTSGFADRHEYALTLGLGLGYTVAALALAAIFPIVLMGSHRMKRVATGVGLALAVMCVAQLAAVISLAGRDSVWYESTSELKVTVEAETGLYASFAAVIALAAAILATHYVGVRRRRRSVPEPEPEWDTDTPRDLTVSAS
jgi:hypothetical protein